MNQGECADDCAGDKSRRTNAVPDKDRVGSGDHRQRSEPELAMFQAKFMAQRARCASRKRATVRQPISEVNHPGGKEQSCASNRINGRMKSPGEEPEPGNGDQRGIETNEVEPDYGDSVSGRDSALRSPRMSWRGIIPISGSRTPQGSVPTQG